MVWIPWGGIVVGANKIGSCAQGNAEKHATMISEKRNSSIEAIISTEHLMLCR